MSSATTDLSDRTFDVSIIDAAMLAGSFLAFCTGLLGVFGGTF